MTEALAAPALPRADEEARCFVFAIARQKVADWSPTLVRLTAFALVACSTSASADAPVLDAGAGSNDAAVEAGIVDAASDAPADGGSLLPTSPQALASHPGKDEDPTLVRARDGTFYLAFYSNRDGSDRIYLATSSDGQSWTAPRAITSVEGHSFYPSLIEANDGVFHLVWWRGSLSDAGAIVGTIMYARSTDTVTWTAPAPLTGSNALAWTPTITERSAGELVVVWSSDETGDKDVVVRSSTNGGASWSPSTTRIGTAAFNDDLPFVVTRSDGSLLMLWQRYDASVKTFEAPFGHPSNDLVYATSADGKAWSAPILITSDPPANAVPDVIGTLYASDDPSGWSAAWASVRGGLSGGNVFSLGLSKAPVATDNLRALTDGAPGGYSPRLVRADRSGLYLMAWVGTNDTVDGAPNLDIFTRLLKP